LSGAGYCFSASSPPFLAAAAQASLKRMEAEPQILDTLKVNVSYFYSTLLAELDGIIPNKLMITSRENISPIVFLQLTKDDDAIISRKQQIVIFDAIAKKCLLNGVFVVSTGRHVMHHLHKVPPPALRLTIMAKQSKADINTAIKVLKHAATDVLRK
jgi:serine palmitoyltransferase